MNKTYKYALYPTKEQEKRISHIINNVNRLKNLYVKDHKNGEKVSDRATELLQHYIEVDNSIIEGTDYSALLNELFTLTDRNVLYADKKVRGYSTSISDYMIKNYPDRNGKAFIPKVGYVRYTKHIEVPKNSKLIKYHITHDEANRYYFSIVFDDLKVEQDPKVMESFIGLDYSAKHLIVDSDGSRYDLEIPNHQNNLDTIAELLKRRENCQKDSINYKRYTLRINKIYKHEANYRNDYLHKLSREFANKYDCVAIEDLSMKEMASEHNMGKSTTNNSYYTFVKYLDYKLKEQGKRLVKIDRYYPSTKTCSVCKKIRPSLPISEREWTCDCCGTFHDRDVNAAINIKEEGKRLASKALDERYVNSVK